MDEILKQILSELKDLRQGQTELRQGQEAQGRRLERLEKGQEAQGRELQELHQGQETLISRVGNLEKGQETLISRVGNLEKGQEAQGQELKELRKDLTKLAVHVEGEITDKIRGLFDGHSLILDSLARIEEKQDRQDERLNQQEILTLNKKRR